MAAFGPLGPWLPIFALTLALHPHSDPRDPVDPVALLQDKLTFGQMREELAKSPCVNAETFGFMGDGLTREPTASALEASLGLSL